MKIDDDIEGSDSNYVNLFLIKCLMDKIFLIVGFKVSQFDMISS